MKLINMLPHYYAGAEEVLQLQNAFENVSEQLHADILDLLKQLYVETATWGLEYWENYLGLSSDRDEPIANRRGRVKTVLRGQGTITKDILKNVCESFVNGEVEIIELSADYLFKIKFVGEIGIPGNIEYIRETINKIKPAHLAFEFIYLYNTHEDLSKFTNAHLSAYTHNQLRNEVVS